MFEHCYEITVQLQISLGTYKAPIGTVQKVLPNSLYGHRTRAPRSAPHGGWTQDDSLSRHP